MTPDQQILAQLMSDLSEDYMCAGWLIGLEKDLWLDLTSDFISPSGFWSEGWNGDGTEYRDRLDEIGRMAARCGGWIVWDDVLHTERFVDIEEWGRIIGLDGPAQFPERFRRQLAYSQDARSKLLEGLSREQLLDLVVGFNHCHEHLQQKIGGGTYMGCLHCGMVEHSYALSRIDCMVQDGPDANSTEERMSVGPFDLDCDPEGVVKRVHDFLRKDFHEG